MSAAAFACIAANTRTLAPDVALVVPEAVVNGHVLAGVLCMC